MNELRFFPEERYQTFERFGVSGAWWAQVVGGWTETDPASGLPKRERIAELLFDREKGIGVRCYRYNLGGGSAKSGKGRIDRTSRRAESFDTDGGGYDWDRDANAVWILKEAVRRGVDEAILFVNSPPERWTRNGKTHQDRAGQTNLPKKNYRAFANYCLDCAEHFLGMGIPVRYLSPVNEPVWFWTGGQEGCHYRPLQVRRLLRVFASEMDRRPALRSLKLSAAENGDIRWFNKTYCRLLLKDPAIRAKLDAVDTHSYFVTPDWLRPFAGDRLPFLRRYRRWMDRRFPGVPLKTSEWTHMQGGRDRGMDSALEQTKIMMEDLTVLNVVSWQLWIAVSDVDYCDGLIYINEDRTYELTKRYSAFGQFSKYIVPGSVRVRTEAGQGLTAVGFLSEDRLLAVVANPTDTAIALRLPAGAAEICITDEARDLMPVPAGEVLTLPAKSVATVIVEEGAAG